MNFFSLLSSESSVRLMITFGHCLWEGLVIAVVAALAARLFCRRNPNLRYGTYLAALVLLVACLPVTYLLVGKSSDLQSQPTFEGQFTQHPVQESTSDGGFSTIVPQTAETRDTDLIQPIDGLRTSDAPRPSGVTEIAWNRVAEWMSWAYLAGVMLMLARLGISLFGAQRICRDTVSVESPAVLRILDELVQELGLRVAPTLEWSKQIVAPTVFGIIRPTILLPFSLATALSPDELSSILAHELAHIRRHDLWINLFQRFVEALLFFHPAVWFLSRRLSAEREYCCDDVALSRGMGSIRYAELLVRLAEVRCRVPSTVEHQVALAAAGDRPSQLRRRVARLFGLEEELTMKLTRRGAMTLAITFVMAAALFTISAPAEPPADADRQDAKEKNAEERARLLAESADAGQPLLDSKLSETERALLGTWERVGFLNQTKLSFTAERSYQYEYSIHGAKQQSGEWKIENGTELVYLTRKADDSAEETSRSRIVAISENELKLQPLSPADQNEVFTFSRVSAIEKAPQRAEATISGRIVFEDGSTEERNGWLYSHSTAGNASTFSTQGQFTDWFSINVRVGTVWLKYFADDHAPAWYGPIEVKDGAMIDDVKIVVKSGYSSKLRVQDEERHPIAGATVVALPEIGGNTSGPRVELTSNAHGEVKLEHLADVPYAFHIEAPGYEPLKIEPGQFSSGDQRLTMIHSQPTTGTVLNSDGSPAKNAKLRLLFEVQPDEEVSKLRYGRDMATTDASGRFTLDQLAREASYTFVVETADSARHVVRDVVAGKKDVVIEVPKRRDLRVRIVGDLSQLQRRSLKPYIDVRQYVEVGADPRQLDLIADGIFVKPTEEGGVAEYRGLVSGQVAVRAGTRTWTSDVADSGTTEVAVDLGGTTELTPEDRAASDPESNAAAATPRTPAVVTTPGVADSRLSEIERALIGTWERVVFLDQIKLTFTAMRWYQYDYSFNAQQSRTGEIPKGEWRIENGTELVYLRRNADGSAAESRRSRIVSVSEKELKLQQLSPAGDSEVYTLTRVAEAGKQSTGTAATPSSNANPKSIPLDASSLYAQELVTVLDKARPAGVIAREQTTFIMADGSRNPSSTSSIFFMSKDGYRYDIYDGDELRETQWYVPDAAGMTQISLRVKSRAYLIEKHPGPSAPVDRVAQLRAVVKAVDRADRRFGPEEIEGIQCVGFEISAAKVPELNSEGTYRVWFNTETKLPVRIETELSELKETAGLPGIRGMIVAFDHFEWSPRLPGNTFIPDIPEETQRTQQ